MPPDDGITREELKLMMEVQSKATEQMILIADRLKEIVDAQKQALDNHSKILIDLNVVKNSESNVKDFAEKIQSVISTMKDDITHSKWFIGIVTLLTAVAIVISRGIDNRVIFSKNAQQEQNVISNEKKMIQDLRNILEEYRNETLK